MADESKVTEKKSKLYSVQILNPKLRTKGSKKYECWVNGNKYVIEEGKPTELKPEVLSHLKNHKTIKTMPTGEESSVDITQGFSREQYSSFNVIEL